jgi:uncharacterized protein
VDLISDIIQGQRRELAQRRHDWIERAGFDKTPARSNLIQVILGPRRAGKSMLAAHLLPANGGYVNFDDERLVGITDTNALVAAIDRIYQSPKHILFDEIQNLPNWELFLNRLQREGRRLLVTGSNANLLSAELATHLTGRHQAIHLLPFSFREVVAAEAKIQSAAERDQRLLQFFHEGGYPEPLLHGVNRADYLRDLLRATIQKDIVRRHRLRDGGGLEALTYHLLSHVAHRFSYRSIAKLGFCSSPMTAAKYVGFLEQAFLVFTLKRFSFSASERSKSDRKLYAIDPGLAYVLGTRPGEDRGRLAENTVACSLLQRQLRGEIELGYWQSPQGEEVDFVIRKNGRVESLIQVCWSIDEPKVWQRESRALLKASEALRCKELICLHSGPAETRSASWHHWRGDVELRPMRAWLEKQ